MHNCCSNNHESEQACCSNHESEQACCSNHEGEQACCSNHESEHACCSNHEGCCSCGGHDELVVVAVSGYFNPLHVGHLEMIEKAKKLGDILVVIINNDKQVAIKGRHPFMSENDRMKIISALRDVDEVFLSIDDDHTVCKSLAKINPDIFANGGDRKNLNDVPEFTICQEQNIQMVDGLGNKIRASSEMIAEANAFKKGGSSK